MYNQKYTQNMHRCAPLSFKNCCENPIKIIKAQNDASEFTCECQAIIPRMKAHNKVILCKVLTCIGHYSDDATKLVVAEKTRRICKCLYSKAYESFQLHPADKVVTFVLPRSRHLGWELPAKSLVLNLAKWSWIRSLWWSDMICNTLFFSVYIPWKRCKCFLNAQARRLHMNKYISVKKDGGPR